MNTVDGAGTNRLDGPPAALPRFETGLAVAELDLHGGALFWEEVKGFTAGPAAAPLVDRVLKARPLPRVWLFLDEPEQTATRAAAALAAARELGRRRYTALVIDADDHRPDLTRWAGRHEREGWIDLVRYGASLAAGSVPVPFEEEPAARLLGVGSFCPAEATREEIAWLCARLSSQADFLLIAAPLGPDGEAWLPAAQLRLLCWDRTGRSEAATAALAAGAGECVRMTRETFRVIGRLVTRKASMRQISGPIDIARISGEAARSGLHTLIRLMGLISLQLGIFNLLPIPILDGGHLTILAFESTIRRDLPLRTKERILEVGFYLLIVLFVVVMFNDIVKILP